MSIGLVLSCLPLPLGFLYQPLNGQIWDPSVTYWRGSWYSHSMYQRPGDRTNVYAAGWLAVSEDGVHWGDSGEICPEQSGDQWWKGFARQIRGDPYNVTDEARFVLNHGVFENGKNDALRFLTSMDLRNWTYAATSHPNATWYNPSGRWDSMYMSRDFDAPGLADFIGFAVSSPTPVAGFAGTWPAVQRSRDGVTWTVYAPLNVSWNGVAPTAIEEGGFERLIDHSKDCDGVETGNRYYLIGGGGGNAMAKNAYSMWVFSSTRIGGPYSPVNAGFRLSGGANAAWQGRFGWLAAWCGPRCDGHPNASRAGPLVSNYITPAGSRSDVWMLPLRKPFVDPVDGRLRLGWWSANEALKGAVVAPLAPSDSTPQTLTCEAGDADKVLWLVDFDAAAHADSGAILELSFVVLHGRSSSSDGASATVGFAVEDVGPPPNATEATYLPATDLPGHDYDYYAVNYTDPRECQRDCTAAGPTCKAWTYVGAAAAVDSNAEGFPVPRCCLKNAVPHAEPSVATTTSGVQAQNGSSAKGWTSLMLSVGVDGAATSSASLLRVTPPDTWSASFSSSSAVLLDQAQHFVCGVGGETCGVATVTAIAAGVMHTVRVLLRKSMWEVYVDDTLAQTFVYGSASGGGPPHGEPGGGGGRVGIACSGGAIVRVEKTAAWRMSL